MVSQTKVAFSLHIIFLNIYIHYSTVHIVHNLLCKLYNTYVQGTYLRPSERSGLPAPHWRRVRRGDELQRFCSRSNISRVNRGDTQEPTIYNSSDKNIEHLCTIKIERNVKKSIQIQFYLTTLSFSYTGCLTKHDSSKTNWRSSLILEMVCGIYS